MRTLPLRSLTLALLLSGSALADTITLSDGRVLDDVKIQTQGLQEVTYKDGRSDESVESDLVVSVTFDKMPALVDSAEAAAREDLLLNALDDLNAYLAENPEPEKRYPWARDYALYRLVEIEENMGNHEQVAAAASRLLKEAPNSRYAPYALLKEASALFAAGDPAKAAKALAEAETFIAEKGLSEGWSLQVELSKALFDNSLRGNARANKFKALSERAGSKYPVVRNRAEVAVGESLMQEAKPRLEEAEAVFQGVVDDPKADNKTLAGAFTGLGDCLFARATSQMNSGDEAAQETFRRAILAYMRVVVSYRNESQYVAKALYQAGRGYHLLGDLTEEQEGFDRARRLYRKVIVTYPGSRWADEAKAQYRDVK